MRNFGLALAGSGRQVLGWLKLAGSPSQRRSSPLVVDGVTGDKLIATPWANKLKMFYNTHSTMLRDNIRKTLIESCSPGQLFEISVTIEDVIESI